jgi:hypothetical protein
VDDLAARDATTIAERLTRLGGVPVAAGVRW